MVINDLSTRRPGPPGRNLDRSVDRDSPLARLLSAYFRRVRGDLPAKPGASETRIKESDHMTDEDLTDYPGRPYIPI